VSASLRFCLTLVCDHCRKSVAQRELEGPPGAFAMPDTSRDLPEGWVALRFAAYPNSVAPDAHFCSAECLRAHVTAKAAAVAAHIERVLADAPDASAT